MDSAAANPASLTPTQQQVVAARGNVLVMAGAGTGKTKTLVERCLDCLQRDNALIDELLIVTFTEAAAAEMRDRLRHAIEARCESAPTLPQTAANTASTNDATATNFWAEQMARFDLAHIGTLHGFCLKLVREHFYELGLDPRLAILAEGESRQLAHEIVDDQFSAHYAGGDAFSLAVQDLIRIHGGGRDEQLRHLVLQLHHYSQAQPDATGWLAKQRAKFAAVTPSDWEPWLLSALNQWRDEWLPVLEARMGDNEKAAELVPALQQLRLHPSDSAWRQAATDGLEQIMSADANWPNKRKGLLRKPLENLFAEAAFFKTLTSIANGHDPLAEDWSWIRGQMETLLRLAEEFAANLDARKRSTGVLDFHDLEQFALTLLWDFATGHPTAIAESWRAKLKFVFVDEYQDINAAQDKIIQGLSRNGPSANRFLVGDVKQSIYRFRLANPAIFRDYARDWCGGTGQTVPLSENFRSRESLLRLVNSLFHLLMRPEVGGIEYDHNAELKFALPESRPRLSLAHDTVPRAELLARIKPARNGSREDESSALASLDDAQREVRFITRRLQELMDSRHEIFDAGQKRFRPAEWRDIAILLRSPRARSEVFAKEFERACIPLAVAPGGFYQSSEILDFLSLLQLLDNPLQDIPCIAVLRSPLVALTLNELAEIRLAAKEKHFWTALRHAAGGAIQNPDALAKISRFLERFSRWRSLAKLVSLSQCLEEILADTLYVDWLQAQPRGAQRAANVASFLALAQEFDQFQRQGLFRFLKFIEAQQEVEAEPEVPALVAENAVRLMSIHQSKGLEFPVVVLADLAKQFNERDLRGDIIFDEEFGLCPKVKPPHVGRRYPSLPHWLAQRRQKCELRGEELRLLYVAMTRARDHLILVASVTEKNWTEKWRKSQPVTVQHITTAKCFADWIALWFSGQPHAAFTGGQDQSAGHVEHLRWQAVSDSELDGNETGSHTSPADGASTPTLVGSPAEFDGLRSRLKWTYPYAAATRQKAKSSVTVLRREAAERDEEAEAFFPNIEAVPRPRRRTNKGSQLSASEIGAAHHKFLQHFDLANADAISAEAERLVRKAYLAPEESAALDLEALTSFWNSPLGGKIRRHSEFVRRELPFTARFSPLELAPITGAKADPSLRREFIIVQGVADLVVLLPHETWLVDFKTDHATLRELPDKVKTYSPQLQLYASALDKIFARKVTLRALHFLTPGRTIEI